MDDKELAAIKARVETATRGYWMAGDYSANLRRNDDQGPRTVAQVQADSPVDVNLLTHAYADLTDLLAEVERARASEAALTQEAQEGAQALLRTHRILSQRKAEWDSKEQALQKSIDEHQCVIAKLEAHIDEQGTYHHQLVRRLADAMEIVHVVAGGMVSLEEQPSLYMIGDPIAIRAQARKLLASEKQS